MMMMISMGKRRSASWYPSLVVHSCIVSSWSRNKMMLLLRSWDVPPSLENGWLLLIVVVMLGIGVCVSVSLLLMGGKVVHHGILAWHGHGILVGYEVPCWLMMVWRGGVGPELKTVQAARHVPQMSTVARHFVEFSSLFFFGIFWSFFPCGTIYFKWLDLFEKAFLSPCKSRKNKKYGLSRYEAKDCRQQKQQKKWGT